MLRCLGLAGLADGVMGGQLMVGYVALVLSVLGMAVAVARKSERWFWVGVVPLAGITLLAQPWRCFAAMTPLESIDPDMVDWHSEYLVWAGWWVAAVVATGAVGFFLWRTNLKRAATDYPSAKGGERSAGNV